MKALWRLVFLLLFFCVADSHAQEGTDSYVQAYRDYRGYLYAFRNGMPVQLESQTVKSFQSRGTIIGYVNNANNLIAWYKGEKNDLGDASNTTYELSDHLLIYRRDQTMGVFDNGKQTSLTHFLRDFQVNDQLIAFRDANVDLLKVYVNGQVQEIEYTGIGKLGGYKAGKNTVAYVSNQGYFKVWYEGEAFDIDNNVPLSYNCGKDVVAWVAGSAESFEVFYKNKVLTLSEIKPVSFQVGDGIVAFQSDEGYFKVFQEGKLLKVESYPPEFYLVRDASVLFFADNKLQVLSSGTRYELDQFKPQSYQLSNNSVAWLDPSRRLFLFSDGVVKLVTTETLVTYQLNGDVLRYDLSDGTSRIYYHGKTH